MCGIAGIFSLKDKPSQHDLGVLSDCLAHRGPDAEGTYMHDAVALAHRRLSILDLSENGNQPMFSHNSRYVMVYNGEIYNYREIANELRVKNPTIQFHSSSDSEIILEAFAQWGSDFVHRLNGMFAICIYDTKETALYIFRDRVGIKPVFYFNDPDNFYFSSELPGLEKILPKQADFDLNAIYLFLSYGCIPAPYSIYKNIKKLDPGSYLILKNGSLTIRKYWDINQHLKSSPTITDDKKAIVLLSDLLKSSVQYQLVSDVPVGIFLSGGIDSSLITALATGFSNVRVNTFTIGIDDKKYDESVYAKKIANYLGTNHHEYILNVSEAKNELLNCMDLFGEPFADSSALPTYLVSKLSKDVVKVVLSGEGGDELFYGYGRYKWAERLSNPLIRNSASLIKRILKAYPKYAAKLGYFNKSAAFNSNIFSVDQLLFESYELEKFLKYSGLDLAEREVESAHYKGMDSASVFDFYNYLPADLLVKIDRCTMANSIEARVPFLDHRVVSCAYSIHKSLKVKGKTQKYILKEILNQYVPAKYFDRPKKGFSIPLEEWLKKDLSFLIDEHINDKTLERLDFIYRDKAEIKGLVQRFRNGESSLYYRIWCIILLNRWFEKRT
jgi:asparagine synthase (glutamine-hydrolysing)